jgi:hypothetical protein
MIQIGGQDSGISDQQIKRGLREFAASSAMKAGLVYFASVFAIGFVLGMIRVPILAPLFGDFIAVLIELPIILTFGLFPAIQFALTNTADVAIMPDSHCVNRSRESGEI